MYFHDDFWEAVSELSVAQRDRAIVAIVTYYFTGQEPDCTGSAKAVFLAVKGRIDLGKERAKNGAKGGKQKPKQNASKTQAKAKQTGKQNASNALGDRDRDRDIDINKEKSIKKESIESQGRAALIAYALEAYNREFGTKHFDLPFTAQMGIGKAYDNGRTKADVDTVLKNAAANWDRQYCTPKGVFGDNFETLLSLPAPEEKPIHCTGIWA